MAHNLATIGGRVAMAYMGETPWHKLGTRVDSMTCSADALQAAALDWRVALRDLFLADGRKVDGRRAVVRDVDSAILGTVGPVWTPIQNAQAFGILDDACRDHGVTIESAGALGNGARVWMLAKLPASSTPIPGDEIRNYFLVSIAHDGTEAHIARPTRVRVVCQNTFNMALARGTDIVRLSHTPTGAKRVDEAARLVSRFAELVAKQDEECLALYHKRLTATQVGEFVNRVLKLEDDEVEADSPQDKRRQDIARLVYHGAGADLAGANARTGAATAWGAFQAVVEFFDHVEPAKSKKLQARRCESALFGLGDQIKARALSVARELVYA